MQPNDFCASWRLPRGWYVSCLSLDVLNLWWFDTPMALFELALGCLLLFRGLRPSPIGACVDQAAA